MSLLKDKKSHFFYYGRAVYRDYLGSEVHVIEKCGTVSQIITNGDKVNSIFFDQCPVKGHNCTDEDCKLLPASLISKFSNQ
jgi:hypothetical protein